MKDVLFAYAMSFAGTPYLWGGDDPIGGIDCSGLVIELMQSVGVLPRGYDSTAGQLQKTLAKQSQDPTVDFGAVLFFGLTKDTITHTAFALTPTLMLEAGGGDSTVTNAAAAATKNAFVRVRPIVWRKDLVATVMPAYSWRKA